ncbi:hypothetical protein EDB81DRAFT_786124 [Dactylonectria macrodidyma]|uniref:Secreted protein n=1 Tax=Dactylonectria macrodidyma TaxID=307937 RepID=A0A9P9J9W7_9HYPO|nr:hypothetical protein EDB81DRAFT_786124 [Dactylonectria macrodidyma]
MRIGGSMRFTGWVCVGSLFLHTPRCRVLVAGASTRPLYSPWCLPVYTGFRCYVWPPGKGIGRDLPGCLRSTCVRDWWVIQTENIMVEGRGVVGLIPQ